VEPSLHHSIFGKTEEKDIQLLSFFLSLGRLFLPDKPIIVIIARISSIFNSEILFSLPLFRQNILRYTARYEPPQYHCGE
jgi:hypothetical protein